MTAALLLADPEPDTRGFLERHLPGDGFQLVQGDRCRPDLVLAGRLDAVERWRDQAPVIVLGRPEADTVDCVHAFRRGCDDYVARPFDYQELVASISTSCAFCSKASANLTSGFDIGSLSCRFPPGISSLGAHPAARDRR